MPSFTDLPIEQGVGDWDINRFRIVFRLPPKSPMTAPLLASAFINGFPGFLDSPAATVTRRDQAGEILLKFYGKLEMFGKFLGSPHPDWVRVIWKDATRGMTVQTLHRDTPDTDDAAMEKMGAGAGGAAGAVGAGLLRVNPALGGAAGAAVGAATAYEVNRYHILAGRRSWLLQPAAALTGPVDPKFPHNEFVLETAAIERISIWPYYPMKYTVMIPSIKAVWTNLLANFVVNMGLVPVEWPLEAGWEITSWRGATVHSYTHHHIHKEGILGSAEGADMIRVFRHIWG